MSEDKFTGHKSVQLVLNLKKCTRLSALCITCLRLGPEDCIRYLGPYRSNERIWFVNCVIFIVGEERSAHEYTKNVAKFFRPCPGFCRAVALFSWPIFFVFVLPTSLFLSTGTLKVTGHFRLFASILMSYTVTCTDSNLVRGTRVSCFRSFFFESQYQKFNCKHFTWAVQNKTCLVWLQRTNRPKISLYNFNSAL